MRDWPLFHQNNNWSQRLILAREMFAEIKAERTQDNLTGESNVQGPDTTAQEDSGLFPEPDIDDSVKFCPDCETPNQFGEICTRCQHDMENEC